jgi:hypothetical protein
MLSSGPLIRPEFRDRVMAARRERGLGWPARERESYESHLRVLLSEAEISKRVKLDALKLILEDGRFKTSHEPGCLQSKNPSRSAAEEAAVWNVPASALSELPIFGYAATAADVTVPETRATLHMAYGSARVLLRREVRTRSTVLFGDSLWPVRHDEGAPASLDAPDELCWLPDRGVPSERHGLDEGAPDEVVEIQIIKGLRLSEVSAVRFDFDPPQPIVDALSERRIGWCVNPMPALPEHSQRSFVRDVLSAGS